LKDKTMDGGAAYRMEYF